MGFSAPLDIINVAIDKVGGNQLAAITDQGKTADVMRRNYDKGRRAELRRNVWRFATRRTVLRPIDTTTLRFIPPLHSLTTPYSLGSVVKDSSGIYYVSQVPNNFGNTPGQGTDAGIWDTYFGPLSAFPYDSGTSYYAGELVYEIKGVDNILIYSSLLTGNENDPSVTQAYSSTTTYNRDNVVLSGGYYWLSLIDRNLNNTPGTYQLWQSTITYDKEDLVYSSVDGFVYSSLIDSNTNSEPSAGSGTTWNNTGIRAPWASSFDQPVGDLGWIEQQDATEVPETLIYPVGSGPLSQSATRNVFRLPNGYLRRAPQSPSAGHTSVLGFPTNLGMPDWEYEGDYLTSISGNAIPFRFVADITKVSQMDDAFCELLACRLALDSCEALTQSASKLEALASEYKKFAGDARVMNGIETDATEPPLDDLIAVRF